MGSLPPGFTKSARRWGVLLLAVWLLALLPARPLLAQDATYTVVAGDTLAAIAERLGVPLDALVAANQIENPASSRWVRCSPSPVRTARCPPQPCLR
ncbi:MAG: LysM domain-containing protein [Caldilineaceae bacterium]